MDPAIGAVSVGHASALDEWIARHGPVWPSTALVVALDACARASAMTDLELRATVGSLDVRGIRRCANGWKWTAAASGLAPTRVADEEVIERLGAILFHALGGSAVEWFSSEQALRAELRTLRPELSAQVIDLTIRAISARRLRVLTLSTFARDLRHLLGVEQRAERPRVRQVARIGLPMLVVAILLGLSWTVFGRDPDVEPHGLTREETGVHDVISETAATYALVDEHTMAVQLYQQVRQIWRARAAPDDPRLAWNQAHEGWVRTLAGDRLTAEQMLEGTPEWLARQLGTSHPYTRAVRLALAETFTARGVDAQAAALRTLATDGLRELFRASGREPDVLDGVPAPPGVVAHVSPNAPEREGFRSEGGGAFVAPLTSIQRLIAGRDGWRLHLVVSGACRASVVIGNIPRRFGIVTGPGPDGRWQVEIQGAEPLSLTVAERPERLGISLVGDGGSTLLVKIGNESRTLSVGAVTNAVDPPYALAFTNGSTGAGQDADRGCDLVWLEIPVPYHPGAKVTTPPASPRP